MYCKYTNNLVNNNINFLNLTKFMLLANFVNSEKLTNKHANIHTKKYLASDIFIMKNLWKGESFKL